MLIPPPPRPTDRPVMVGSPPPEWEGMAYGGLASAWVCGCVNLCRLTTVPWIRSHQQHGASRITTALAPWVYSGSTNRD